MRNSDKCRNASVMLLLSRFLRQAATSTAAAAMAGATDATAAPAAATNDAQSPLHFPHRFIDRVGHLKDVADALATSKSFAIDVEAFCTQSPDKLQLGQVSLLQMCSHVEPCVYVVDVLTLGKDEVRKHLQPVMESKVIRKLMFDCRRDVEAISWQLGMNPAKVLDLQLLHAAVSWKLRGSNRRSGLQFVLRQMCKVERQEGDSAVAAAMTLGNRAVWDVRPLPDHFVEYAADDVRHLLLMADRMLVEFADRVEAVERLTRQYVEHYAVGTPVTSEADPQPNVVHQEWLERFLGPAGNCAFCGQRGHTDSECFKRVGGVKKCTHCGEAGHLANQCFKKHPQLLKCAHCGQLGHTANRCFALKPCDHCGGQHSSDKCSKKPTA
jgi:hypothetical protein